MNDVEKGERALRNVALAMVAWIAVSLLAGFSEIVWRRQITLRIEALEKKITAHQENHHIMSVCPRIKQFNWERERVLRIEKKLGIQ